MTDQNAPMPAPTCIDCDSELNAVTSVWPLNDEGKRRWIDTGYPCGHVQLDTVIEADGLTMGQLTARHAANTIRLIEAILGPVGADTLLGLADQVEHYNGADLCPLCTHWPHDPKCPLSPRAAEVIE